jgi:pSer/pThr/pTyr-binding forkhead associated (FHA) protein
VGLILEIKAGPLARKSLSISSGKSILVGRAPDRAQFAIPHDTHMSGVHFAVECGPSGCRVIDKGSTNGTQLNGAKIQEAMLASGDEIKSGQTVFIVRIVPDDRLPATPPSPEAVAQPSGAAPREIPSPAPARVRPPADPLPAPAPSQDRTHKMPEASPPSASVQDRPAPRPVAPTPRPPAPGPLPSARSGQPPALAVGSWAFAKIPPGWQIQEGLGIQLDAKDDKVFPSNVGAMEEPLSFGFTLPDYVELQTKLFREYLREPKIDAALPPMIPGATETVALEVRFGTKDGPAIFYRRIYARCGSTIGLLTLTTLEKDLPSVRAAYDAFVSGASFVSNR